MSAHDPDRPLWIKAVVYTTAGFIVLGVLVAFVVVSERNLGFLSLVAIVAGFAAAGAGLGAGVAALAGGVSGGLIRVLQAAGDMPPAPSYSHQEALAAQGRYAEAADAYRRHLAAHPADHDARLALAVLLAGPLGDPGGAERLYLEVRTGNPSPRQEMTAHQALIDLHASTGQRGRQLVELARFADRYRGTAAGTAAREALKRMKRE